MLGVVVMKERAQSMPVLMGIRRESALISTLTNLTAEVAPTVAVMTSVRLVFVDMHTPRPTYSIDNQAGGNTGEL
ncbi:hypothetical protein SUGI_0261520 [Cryptomeria japonica]|nr:hypothetical protein SUGI_0261520 [Cryptomeria japonica]